MIDVIHRAPKLRNTAGHLEEEMENAVTANMA